MENHNIKNTSSNDDLKDYTFSCENTNSAMSINERIKLDELIYCPWCGGKLEQKKEYHLQFRWDMLVEAESLEEAKQTAPDVLFNHLRQVTLEPTDFFEVIEK